MWGCSRDSRAVARGSASAAVPVHGTEPSPPVPSSAVESKSTGSILDDIGSMFDDLADQLDAMLE